MKLRFTQWLAAVPLALCTLLAQAGDLPGPVVDSQWLTANADKVQIVEVRGNVKSFTAKPEIVVDSKGKKSLDEIGGHLPGSILMDTKKMRADRKVGDLVVKYMNPGKTEFEQYVQASGVNKDKAIVLVPIGQDVGDMNDALRMYWQFKVYGEDNIAVLDGGLANWLLEGKPYSTEAAPARVGTWVAKADRSKQYTAESEDVAQAISKKSASLVDSRDNPLFHGLVKRDYVFASGHLEGAKLYPTDLMFKNSGGVMRFMSKATYKDLVSAQGIDPAAPAITYCNSGHLSSASWFVLSELLGNSSARLYDGSLHQWTLEKRPLVGAVSLK